MNFSGILSYSFEFGCDDGVYFDLVREICTPIAALRQSRNRHAMDVKYLEVMRY